jgi:hypothetical protein
LFLSFSSLSCLGFFFLFVFHLFLVLFHLASLVFSFSFRIFQLLVILMAEPSWYHQSCDKKLSVLVDE